MSERAQLPGQDVPVTGLLEGQTALITGAGRGIGRATAHLFARAGARVVVSDIAETSARRVAEEIVGLGGRAIGVGGDVTSADGRRGMVAAAEGAFGPVDCLVNNAGIMRPSHVFDLTEAEWDRMLDINARAVFFMSQLVLRGMVERRRGTVVSLASAAGKIANGVYWPHYNVAKAAVIAMTKTLSHAVADRGVRVNCVAPGVIDTAMWEQIDREVGQGVLGKGERELFNERIAQIPMRRAGTPHEVARVILFLASPLSSYLSGQAINITGGWLTY